MLRSESLIGQRLSWAVSLHLCQGLWLKFKCQVCQVVVLHALKSSSLIRGRCQESWTIQHREAGDPSEKCYAYGFKNFEDTPSLQALILSDVVRMDPCGADQLPPGVFASLQIEGRRT